MVFNADSFDEDTFTKVAVISKTSINVNDQTITPFNYIPTKLERADSVWPGSKTFDEYYSLV